ncbi:hypothetical protein NL676_024988 [Syzygium grande]|nr:hypothetical protein NL676_024988 [Syzygium grande]
MDVLITSIKPQHQRLGGRILRRLHKIIEQCASGLRIDSDISDLLIKINSVWLSGQIDDLVCFHQSFLWSNINLRSLLKVPWLRIRRVPGCPGVNQLLRLSIWLALQEIGRASWQRAKITSNFVKVKSVIFSEADQQEQKRRSTN